MIGCVVLTQGRRPAELAAALESLAAQAAWRPTSSSSATAGSRRGCRRRANGGARRGPRHPGRPQRRRRRGRRRAAVLPRRRRPPGLARRARPRGGAVRATRASACCSCACAPPTAGRRRATGCRGCGSATRARSSDVTAVWEGAVAVRRTVFEQVGGWPEAFRFAHEGVDLAWRVMDTGRRVDYAGDIEVLHPAYAHGAARLLGLLRRPQPRLSRPPPPAAAARRPLRRRLRAAHAAGAATRLRPRRAARLPRRAAPAVRRAPPPACEHSVAMTRAGRPPVI